MCFIIYGWKRCVRKFPFFPRQWRDSFGFLHLSEPFSLFHVYQVLDLWKWWSTEVEVCFTVDKLMASKIVFPNVSDIATYLN
jgi:hypothetical protein